MMLSFLIPVYNEEKTLVALVTRIRAVNFKPWNLELVFVDDGSSDHSREILERLRGEPGVTVVFHEKNSGKASAVRTALSRARGDYMIIQDADLEYDPAEIPALLAEAAVGPNTVVYGSRNLRPRAYRGFLLPRFGAWLITRLVNWLYRARLTDVWTCYKLFPRAAAERVGFPGGGFEGELLFTTGLIRAGFTIVEVPISHAPRSVAEGKKIRYRDGFTAIRTLFADRFGSGGPPRAPPQARA